MNDAERFTILEETGCQIYHEVDDKTLECSKCDLQLVDVEEYNEAMGNC